MDQAKLDAILNCGRCHLPERDHQYPPGTEPEEIAVLVALGGPCESFVVSDAALLHARYLAIVDNRTPRGGPGRVGKRNPPCDRCGHRHRGDCVIQPGPRPGPNTLANGAALARAALNRALGRTTPEGS